MRAYITAPMKGVAAKDPEAKVLPLFSGNQTDGSAHRKQLQEEFGFKRTEVETKEVDIPTGKADLLPWLNAWVKKTFG